MKKNSKSILIIALVIILAAVLFLIAKKLTSDPSTQPEAEIQTMKRESDESSPHESSAKASADSTKKEETAEESKTSEETGTSGGTEAPDTSAQEAEAAALMASLKFQDASGNELSFADFSDKYIVVNYWASWCPPCKAEMPDLQKFYEAHKDEEDFVFIALNATDGGRETKETADAFIKGKGYSFPVYYDSSQDVGLKLNLSSLPSTFTVAPGSRPAYFMQGMRTLEDFESLLEQTRSQMPPQP